MQSINLSIVTTSNFAPLLAQISTLEARLKSLNALTATAGSGFTSAQAVAQLKSLQKAYHETMMASKGFQSTTFTATTTAQLLSKRLATNTLSALDYRNALRSVTNQSNLFNLVGQRQIAVQNSNLLVTGKTATAYTALAVDMTNATIKSQVYTQAILAQKAALSQLAVNLVNAGKNMQWAGRQLTAGLTMPVAMIGAASAAMFNTVDKNLTRLSKVYGVGLMQPTVSELQRVRKEVIGLSTELGASLGISAKEVTDIAAQFAAAGLTGKVMLEATKQASRMVVLGEADKQQAINATISLQTAYKLNTNQLTEAVNFFNAAQAATSTNMADLIEAIPRTGPVIRGLGGTYKDMVSLLVAMKEGGVPAGEAANAIKNSLGRIINPTKAAQEQLKSFGIDIKNIVSKNAGNLVAMLIDLQTQLDRLPNLQRQQAIAELFGKFQFARMAALMDNFNKTGTQSAKVIEMMELSAGELSDIADKQTKKIQQSASGRFKIAVESLKNSLIPFGETMLELGIKIVNTIKKIADFIEGLPGPIKTVLKLGAAIGLIAGPLLMFAGLFRNLIGNLTLKIFIPLITGLKAIASGVNPLTVLRAKFREFHVEETLAEKASNQFAAAMNKVVDANELMISGIKEQIVMVERLISTLSAATEAETALSVSSATRAVASLPMGSIPMTVPMLSTTIAKQTQAAQTNTTYSHLIPKSILSETYGTKALASQGIFIPSGNPSSFQEKMGAYMPPTVVAAGTSIEQMRQTLINAAANAKGAASEITRRIMLLSEEEIQALFISEEAYAKYAAAIITDAEMVAMATQKNVAKIAGATGSSFANQLAIASATGNEALIAQLRKSVESVDFYWAEHLQKNEALLMAQLGKTAMIPGVGTVPAVLHQAGLLEAKAIQTMSDQKLRPLTIQRNMFSSGIYHQNQVATEYNTKLMQELNAATEKQIVEVNTNTERKQLLDNEIIQTEEELALAQRERARIEWEAAKKAEIAYLSKLSTGYNLTSNQLLLNQLMRGSNQLIKVDKNIPQLASMNRNFGNAFKVGTIGMTDAESRSLALAVRNADKQLIKATESLAYERQGAGITTVQLKNAEGETIRSLTLLDQEVFNAATAEQQHAASARLIAAKEEMAAGMPGGIIPTTTQRIPKERGQMGMRGSMGAMLGSMGLMMGGSKVGGKTGETMTAAGEGLMFGSMAAMMMPQFAVPILALSVAIPLLIKGIQFLNESTVRFGKTMKSALSVSSIEADKLGIKLSEIGNFTFAPDTQAEKDRLSKVSELANEIKQASETDPLRQMADSIKEMSRSEVIQVLKAKAISLTLQGATDSQTRLVLQAILQAAGKEVAYGSSLNGIMSSTQGSTADLMIQQLNLAGSKSSGIAEFVQGLAGGPDFLSPGLPSPYRTTEQKTAGITKEQKQAYADQLNSMVATSYKSGGVSKLSTDLRALEKAFAKDTTQASMLYESIRMIYEQSAPNGGEAFDKLTKAGISMADSLTIAGAKAQGLNINLDDLTKHPYKINAIINFASLYSKEKNMISQANDIFASATNQEYAATLKNASSGSGGKGLQDIQKEKIKAQEEVISKLEAEQKLRNEIADAQKRELEYTKSKADIQGQIQEALASGDVGKAISLQNDLNSATANYNTELKKASDQKLIDVEKNKLDALKSQLDQISSTAKDSATAAQTEVKKLTDIQDSISKEIADTVHKGQELTNEQIKKLTDQLTPFFGSTEKAKQAVLDLVKLYQTSPEMTFAKKASAELSSLVGTQSQAILAAAIYKNMNSSQYSTANEATLAAIRDTMPGLSATLKNGKIFVLNSQGKSVQFDANKIAEFVNTSPGAALSNQTGAFGPGTGNVGLAGLSKTTKKAMGGYIAKYFEGSTGSVRGPGTSTSDSIPAMLSDGEYVVRASAVNAVGVPFMDAVNRLGHGGYVVPKMYQGGMLSFDSGGQALMKNTSNSYESQYNINVNVAGTNATADEIANCVIKTLKNQERMISGPRYIS